jgi:hypothetical protein
MSLALPRMSITVCFGNFGVIHNSDDKQERGLKVQKNIAL